MTKPLSAEDRRYRAYRARNETVRAMGYESYTKYLESELWATIRLTVLAERPLCHSCGAPATQVHHGCYKRRVLEGRDRTQLFPVCGKCHKEAEFRNRDGEKLNPHQATVKLNQIRKNNDGKPKKKKKGGRPELGLRHKYKWQLRRLRRGR